MIHTGYVEMGTVPLAVPTATYVSYVALCEVILNSTYFKNSKPGVYPTHLLDQSDLCINTRITSSSARYGLCIQSSHQQP